MKKHSKTVLFLLLGFAMAYSMMHGEMTVAKPEIIVDYVLTSLILGGGLSLLWGFAFPPAEKEAA